MDITEKRQPVEKAQEEMSTHPEGSNAQSHANTAMQALGNCVVQFPSSVLCDGMSL